MNNKNNVCPIDFAKDEVEAIIKKIKNAKFDNKK